MTSLADLPFELFSQILEQSYGKTSFKEQLLLISRVSKSLAHRCQLILFQSFDSDHDNNHYPHLNEIRYDGWDRQACLEDFKIFTRAIRRKKHLAKAVRHVYLDRCILQAESREIRPGPPIRKVSIRSDVRESLQWRLSQRFPKHFRSPYCRDALKVINVRRYAPVPKRKPRGVYPGITLRRNEVLKLVTAKLTRLESLRIWSLAQIEQEIDWSVIRPNDRAIPQIWLQVDRTRSLDADILAQFSCLKHLTKLDAGTSFSSLLKLTTLREFSAEEVRGVLHDHDNKSGSLDVLSQDDCHFDRLTLKSSVLDVGSLELLLTACRRLEPFTFAGLICNADRTFESGKVETHTAAKSGMLDVLRSLRKHKTSLQSLNLDMGQEGSYDPLAVSDLADFTILKEIILPSHVLASWLDYPPAMRKLGIYPTTSMSILDNEQRILETLINVREAGYPGPYPRGSSSGSCAA